MSNEYTTLCKCASQLEAALMTDIGGIGSDVFSEGLIDREFYEKVMAPKSALSDADHAAMLVAKLMDMVDQNSINYYKLMNRLRQRKRNSGIVDLIDRQYFDAPEENSKAAIDLTVLHNELSVVKDKWHKIGKAFHVECVEKFNDLVDPLLEVIVHWLKRKVAVSPSWESVVATLRKPEIDEAELADKIGRLYCDHKDEERAKRTDDQTFSDVTSELMKVPLKNNYNLPDDTQNQRFQMMKETEAIKKQYDHFTTQLMLDLQKERKDVSVIINQLVMYDRKLKIPLTGCRNIAELFEILCVPKYSSFLDYELIKLLTDYGNDRTQCDFIEYKRKLQKFLESRLVAVPSSKDENAFAVVIDENIVSEFTNLNHLQNRVKFILGHRGLKFIYCENSTQSHLSAVEDRDPPAAQVDAHPQPATQAQVGPHSQPKSVTTQKPAEEAVNGSNDATPTSGESNFDPLAASTASGLDGLDLQTLLSSAMSHSDNIAEDVDESFLQSLHSEIADSIVTLESVLSGLNDMKLPEEGDMNLLDNLLEDSDMNLLDDLVSESPPAPIQGGKLDLDSEFLDILESAKQLSSKTELHIKASDGDLPGIIEMMKKGQNPLDRDENGFTAPHYAAALGHLHIVKYFIDDLGYNPTIADDKGFTLLHSAILGPHLDIVRYLLNDKDVEPLCHAEDGITPLHLASLLGELEIVQELMQKISFYMPGQVLDFSEYNQTPLHFAARGGHLSVVKYLTLEKDFSLTAKDKTGCIPLHLAAMDNKIEVVKFLASSQFSYDLMIKNENGDAAIHCAADEGHLDVINFFIKHCDCSPIFPGSSGLSLLHMAANHGHLHIVKYLTDLQDYKSYCGTKHKVSPVHLAASHGHLQVFKFLVKEKNCDPMCKDIYGHTPLYLAAQSGHLPVVKYISSLPNCNPNATSLIGRTPLFEAAIAGNLDVVKYFIEELGCDPNPKSKFDNHLINVAMSDDNLPVVKYLILNHCSPDEKNDAFLFAAAQGYLEVVRLLCSIMDCSPEIVDKRGCNALYIAAVGNHVPVVRYLISEGKYDPLCTSFQGTTPFHFAAMSGEKDVVRFYVSELKCSAKTLDNIGNNALHTAVIGDSLAVVKYLTEEAGFDPSSSDAANNTPLHLASTHGHLSLVKFFASEKKCDPLIANLEGYSPFTAAVRMGKLPIVQFFTSILNDAAQAADAAGHNALHVAAMAGHLEVVCHLIEQSGFDPSCCDLTQATPLHYAAANGRVSVIWYLVLDKKCNISCKNIEGKTPLEFAVEHGQNEAAECILSLDTT